MLQTPSPSTVHGDLGVDYVLHFEAVPRKHAGGAVRASETLVIERRSEYDRLVQRLAGLGLEVTARVDTEHDGHLLVFVHAPDALLQAMRRKEQ